MGNVSLELVETGEQRDAVGRKRTPHARRAELVEAFKRSGLSMASFAARERLTCTTFAGWVQRSRRERKARRPQPVAFARVQLPIAASTALEVQWPDGTVLRGGDATALAALAKALRS